MDEAADGGIDSSTGVRAAAGRPSRRGVLAGAAAALGTGTLLETGSAHAATTAAGTVAAGAGSTASASAPVGFVLSHEQFRTPHLVHWARLAEEAGFRHVWTSDHFQPWQEDQHHAMSPWNTLALVAEHTARLHLGSGVTCPTYRHRPAEVAQAFASLGILAPGRVFLGVGTGEALNELAATGEFGRYPERAARLVEAVRLIRRLWTGERTTFHGTYYRTEQARLYDVPSTPIPIYMAASGPKSAYSAGRHGDGWICGSKDLFDPTLRAAFTRGARAAGRNSETMPKFAELFVTVGGVAAARKAAQLWRFTADAWNPALLYEPNPVRIQRKAEKMFTLKQVYGAWPVSTDPAVHIKAAQKVIDAGGTPFIHSGQPDQEAVIALYGRHVLPHLHRRPRRPA